MKITGDDEENCSFGKVYEAKIRKDGEKIAKLSSVGFADSGKWYGSLTELTKSSRYGYGSLTGIIEILGIVAVQNSHMFRAGLKMSHPYPGYCGTGSQKFWVQV